MNRIIWLFLLFSLLGKNMLYADNQSIRTNFLLPPPIWSCIETVGADVVLNWEPVADPGGNFVAYEIHSLEDGLITSIPNIAINTYTHVGIGSVKNYFISVIDNVTGATNSITLRNIHLTLNNPNNGLALLSWNQSGYSMPGPPTTPVDILKEYPAGTWITENSVSSTTTFYKDTIDVCQAMINYQIVHPGNGCDFTSNTIGDVFEDKITPDIPVLSNATIDTLTGNLNLSWSLNGQPDTYGYVVYMIDATGFLVEIDTVWGQGNTSYSYVENTSTGPLTYSIAAFDSCFTASTPATYQTSAKADVHTTVFLSGIYSECGSFATLYWSNYLGWDVDYYEFYYHEANQNWISIPNLNVNQYTMVLPNTATYEFVVQSHHADGRSTFSNIIQITATASAPPSINYLTTATVIDQQVNLSHFVDTSGNVFEVAFEWLQKDGSFKEVGRVPVFQPFNSFIHENANVEEVNTYRAVIIDSCGNQTTISNIVQTVLLDILGDSINLTNTLNWTPYVGFDGTIIDYEIYRSIDGEINPIPITNTGPGVYSFVDFVSDEIVRNNLCYHVIAIEEINQYGFSETATSNVKCGEFSPTVFIPTAFTPNGFNPIFRPEYSYMKFPYFYMKIFDRWGQVIHETENPLTGWDGTIFNGNEQAPNDNYHYMIRFYGIDDLEKVYTGHFLLLR
jgi:gliding motility-associated-like protein